ncbi:MAG: hypothetical protein QM771_16150 [Nitrospira sp.]
MPTLSVRSQPALALVFAFALLPAIALADFVGQVVGVIDGDTIDVQHDGKPERIGLNISLVLDHKD